MPTSVLQVLNDEASKIEAELQRRRWALDPVAWARERLGDTLWSKQREIATSVARNRRTAVKSCHEIGKSYIAATIAGWWLDTNKAGEAFVVTSAPSGPQVKAILWREIGRVHARGNLAGRVNQTEWYMVTAAGNEELVAFGRKPDDYDPTAFQGIHAPRVLYIFDEACGIPASLWEAGDSLIANDLSKALAIGNPDDPQTEFYQICTPGSGWNVISVNAFETPNLTNEPLPERIKQQLIGSLYIEEKRRKWASRWYWNDDRTAVLPPEEEEKEPTAAPLWYSKVLGEFPRQQTDELALLPMQWVRQAQQRTIEPADSSELGVDVGAGGDASTVAHRRGCHVRIKREDRNPDTMQTCGNVIRVLDETKATIAKVDTIGIGRGVVDRGKELGRPFVGINVSEASDKPEEFVNYRSELWWTVRGVFERKEIDIDEADEDLAAELCSIRYKVSSKGQIQIESKADARKRGVASPNRAEAVMLTYARTKRGIKRATWGR